MKKKYQLTTNIKGKANCVENIDLFRHAEELWNELDKTKIMERMINLPQLGAIKLKKQLKKSRYDYMMLQLYLHQIIKTELKNKLNISYNNKLGAREFEGYLEYGDAVTPTIADCLQILAIVSNIGHAEYTFVSSKAIIDTCRKSQVFKERVVNASQDSWYRQIAEKTIAEDNYLVLHWLNAYLILDACDNTKFSVRLAKALIRFYLDKSKNEQNKLLEVFHLFRAVRNVAYISYDLQIASLPFVLDVTDKTQLTVFFKEYLAQYNNKDKINELILSLQKMLDDAVYFDKATVIRQSLQTQTIARLLLKETSDKCFNYIYDCLLNSNSAVNNARLTNYKVDNDEILKLTFANKYQTLARQLIAKFNSMRNVIVGYYLRNSGDITIVITVKKRCSKKHLVAFNVLKRIISVLIKVDKGDFFTKQYLLAVKFFLYFYFGSRSITISQTLNKTDVIFCSMSKKKTVSKINNLLQSSDASLPQKHEVEHLLYCLQENAKRETSIALPDSIVVYRNDGQTLCELDGMIIYPNRKLHQIVLMEAKAISECGRAEHHLKNKLEQLHIPYNYKDIIHCNNDVKLELTIK